MNEHKDEQDKSEPLAQNVCDDKQTEQTESAQDGIEHCDNEQSDEQNIKQDTCEQDYKIKYEELKDQYVRAFADFENTKKRLERDKNQSLEYANERIMNDLLPVLDTLEKALESAQSNPQATAIAQGLELTLDSFIKVLNKHGVEVISTDGEFDPNLHECLMQVPDDSKSDGVILQTLQRGFIYKQRVLRPSMVSVVKNA